MLFRVLGPLETCPPGGAARRWGARKPAALLATLLLNAGEWVSCERLVDAVWTGRTPPPSAESNVKTYVWQLRKSLGERASSIESGHGAYRITVAAGDLDVDRFKDHTRLARHAMADGDPAGAVVHLETALALWRGVPFADLPDDVTAPVVAELDELRWELRETLADALTALGRFRDAVALLRELTIADPLRERLWARLVRVLVRADRRSEALAAYERARTVIADELGVGPGPDLTEAHRLALADPTASLRELPRAVPDFTGRQREVASIVHLSRSSGTCVPVAVVDGEPGIGKTALAVHVAHLVAERFPDGQLYVDLNRDHGPDLLARLLRKVGLHDVPAAEDDRAAAWRAALAGRRVLLVLDGAASEDQVTPLLPGTAGCMVLVTTDAQLRLEAVRTTTLTALSATETTALFRADAPYAPADVVREAAGLTGGIPSAVRTAAALAHRHPRWTGHRLAAELAAQHRAPLVTVPVPRPA